jgi:hypothetical protein
MTAAVLKFKPRMMALDAPDIPVEQLFSDVVACNLPEHGDDQDHDGELYVADSGDSELINLILSCGGARVYVELTSMQATALGRALL